MKVVFVQSANRPGDLIAGWCTEIGKNLKQTGGECLMTIKYRRGECPSGWNMVGSSWSCALHHQVFEYTGLQDMFSCIDTLKFLRYLKEIKPDIIHCHVVNDMFLNLRLFCNYVNKHNIKVVWTFHDARVLTGQCPYPDYSECDEWKTQCHRCPSENRFLAPSKKYMNLVSCVQSYRKGTIGKIKDLTIVTPSQWLSSLVSRSYLSSRRCVVINNGINLDAFHRIESEVRFKYGIGSNNKILLAIGNPLWRLKGQEYLHRLIEELPETYSFVMIGCLPEDVVAYEKHRNVVALSKVDRNELAAFYSAADLFVNPTLSDNFPTVNLEAQACGCPVVAFDSGGTKETVAPRGCVVPRRDYVALKKAIVDFDYIGAREDAIAFAAQYSQERCIQSYISLYHSILS